MSVPGAKPECAASPATAGSEPSCPEMSAEGCNCVAKMNDVLKDHNTALVVPLLGPARCLVEAYKIERRGKRPPHVFANYCPFCGIKYGKSVQ